MIIKIFVFILLFLSYVDAGVISKLYKVSKYNKYIYYKSKENKLYKMALSNLLSCHRTFKVNKGKTNIYENSDYILGCSSDINNLINRLSPKKNSGLHPKVSTYDLIKLKRKLKVEFKNSLIVNLNYLKQMEFKNKR